jgi:hypothetical protein
MIRRARWSGVLVGLTVWLATGAEERQQVPKAAEVQVVIAVIGAAGEPGYEEAFSRQMNRWQGAARAAGARWVPVGTDPGWEPSDRDRLNLALELAPKQGTEPLWLVLMGHGTFDGREAKFNLRGPDVSAEEMRHWLEPFRRPLVILHTGSASAPFLKALSGPDRVVVSATRSGFEQNYARFGEYVAEAITNPDSDLDQDGQVSVLEAFLAAARRTAEFYQTEGRLATEHALLDDNGDGLGTPADWFRGLRAVRRSVEGAALDGGRAHQIHLVRSDDEAALTPELRARRDALERRVEQLRSSKGERPEAEYYLDLEAALVELARLLERDGGDETGQGD